MAPRLRYVARVTIELEAIWRDCAQKIGLSPPAAPAIDAVFLALAGDGPAALRVRAALLRPFGLRHALAPRDAAYAALPPDPLEGDDGEASRARAAAGRAVQAPFGPFLELAIAATEKLARAEAWPDLEPRPPLHATGLPMPARGSRAAASTCGGCAWYDGGHCRPTAHATSAAAPACERFEPPLDCAPCGACCREAFHGVEVAEGDLLKKLRPELVDEFDDEPAQLLRPDGRCPLLSIEDGAHRCTLYDARPTACREFEAMGDRCLTARRRVGLTR